MNLMLNDNQSIQKEAIMILELFVKHINNSAAEGVRKIIEKNKITLMNYVKNISFEGETENYQNKELLLH